MYCLTSDVDYADIKKFSTLFLLSKSTQEARCIWEPRPAPAEGAYRVSSLQEEASAVVEEIGARRVPPATSLAATMTGEE